MNEGNLRELLICGVVPYFLERENSWIEKNKEKILSAQKTQAFFQENCLYLKENQRCFLSQILRRLDEMGYEKVWETREIGEFSQRGGILDVFPINQSFAVRIEFFGNKIEKIYQLKIKIDEEKKAKEILRNKLKSQKLYSNLTNLKEGDYLVHLDHGIGKFIGIKKLSLPHSQKTHRFYLLEYSKGDKLYIPFGLERKLTKYIGFETPELSRLSSPFWQKTKKRIKEETEKIAKELLEIYAKREITKREPHSWDQEIELPLISSFPFVETPDQAQTLREIEEDLKKERPMDRIVCGDVGFGKTEIALRTMVKIISAGYQALMICPTTILAYQHFQNFKERLKNLPINLALLTRFQKEKEQKEIVKKIKEGKIDILVATRRALSNDVDFKNLGLLVIDDEHKFGVKDKEKIKKLKSDVDVLSLSATPIPRTLYMALSSLKNISLIQTPPEGKLPVKTFILPFSKEVIKRAIERELERKGQVYYLHNQTKSIKKAKLFLEKLVPKARIAIAHAKLREEELLKTMIDFQKRKIDVLVATTIIENGLDLPAVNTLIVSHSEKLGLSQAYQIKGRVGRSFLEAFAYFLYSPPLSERAKMRLKALKSAEKLGSGYKIALKDLEMRGAGNILGKEQSGNINKIGLNLYCQMLAEAMERLRS